jgi:chromosome segregation ATPase
VNGVKIDGETLGMLEWLIGRYVLQTSLSLELQSKVSEQEDTISHQEAIVESLRDTNQQLTSNIESLSTKLKEVRQNYHFCRHQCKLIVSMS